MSENLRKSIKIVFHFSFICFLLAAYANASSSYHIKKEARPFINETDVYLAVPQKELQIYSANSIPVTDGLFVALITGFSEHNQTKNLNATQNSMKGKLSGYDYADFLGKKINSELKNINWLNTNNIVVENDSDSNWSENRVNESLSSAVLLIVAKYFLSTDLDVVNTVVSLRMFPKSVSLEKFKEKPNKDKNNIHDGDVIYRNNFVASTTLFSANDQENTLILGKSDKAALIDALEANASKIATLISSDIKSDSNKTK